MTYFLMEGAYPYKERRFSVLNEETYLYFTEYVTVSGKSHKGFHSRTVKQYQKEIERYEAFSGMDFSLATRESAQEYRDFLVCNNLSATTIAKSMHILSAFGTFLHEKTRFVNPFYRLNTGQTYLDYTGIEVPTPDELEPFFLSVAETNESAAMAARIVYAVGCGLEELLSLTVACVEIAEDEQRIALLFHNYAPFQLMRRVVLPTYLYEDMRAFLSNVPFVSRDGMANDCIFTNQSGKKLSVWSCEHALRQSAFPYTMQKLKTFASIRLVNQGAELSEICAFTGRTDRWIRRYKQVSHLPPSLSEES